MRHIPASALFLLAIAASAATAQARGTVPLEVVYQKRVDWDDRVVLVRGWLQGCHGGMLCVLTKAPRHGDLEDGPQLTLDFVEDVEPRLGALDGREVILRGRVTDECAGDNICVDRGPDIVPIAIVRVLPAKS